MALPDRPDAAQLRIRAKELKRAARAGDPEAMARASAHGAEPSRLTLRRAQHIMAREHGLASWADLMAAAAGGRRVARAGWDGLVAEAQEVAGALGAGTAGPEHLLLVATDPARTDHSTPPGFDRDGLRRQARNWAEAFSQPDSGGDRAAVGSSPVLGQYLGAAYGLAVSRGRSEPTAAELVLAYLYAGFGSGLSSSTGLDPDEVVEAMAEADRPAVAPPRPPAAFVPQGEVVYVPRDHSGTVSRLLIERHPPGSGRRWGMNSSSWRPGWTWIHGDDVIPLADLVATVVGDPASVVVVPWRESLRLEAEARRRDGEPGR